MKKIFSFVLLLMFVCATNQAFCAKHKRSDKRDKNDGIAQQISFLRYEIEQLENSSNKENRRKLKEWIDIIELKVQAKMDRENDKLERYGRQLNEINTPKGEDDIVEGGLNEEKKKEYSESIQSKILSVEHKINALRELLQSLDQMKSRINKY